ncbi:hypothetical protein BOTCAL_0281g00100 [Botryotinia calthae]|uniref:Uncharacterized protein n=1 Tax=Botryotinia calthae TaxID=38488 RepID=A0A4Y8CV71_9HELO|nr:hypothetical protein BOTCAL_0281g00100 [Botryotinia calthae]
MPPTETLDIVTHQTSTWAATTPIAVVDAVVSAPVALPSSTEYCSTTHHKDFTPYYRFFGLLICFFVFIYLEKLSTFDHYGVTLEDFKDAIACLKYGPKQECEEIIYSQADTLGNWTEYPPHKVHHSKKKKKRSLLSIFWGASSAIERDNDVKDYIRGVREFSKSIEVGNDGNISQDTIDDLFLNVYPMRRG